MGNSWSDIFDGDDSLAKNVVPIATSPRSGSHFLCSLLYLSGLGVPFEYFIKGTIDQYHERFKIEGRVSKGRLSECFAPAPHEESCSFVQAKSVTHKAN